MSKMPVLLMANSEHTQNHDMRKKLLHDLSDKFEKPVITFFTSLHMHAPINDEDVFVMKDIVRTVDLSNGLVIMIESHGGYGLSAERIINLLRTLSGTGEYTALVPGMAKSAATMICLGANKILMNPASELGPIDPQITLDNEPVSAHNAIRSYQSLFAGAENTQGRVEPFLQQLSSYNDAIVNNWEQECQLSEDIAVRCLHNGGMLNNIKEKDIKKKIGVFLFPDQTIVHARPIFYKEAKSCGLDIEEVDIRSDIGELIHELHVRTRMGMIAGNAIKIIETAEKSCLVPIPS